MKPILFLAISLFLFSCKEQKETSINHFEKNKAVADALFEAFNAHQWEKMAALYSENAEFKDPSFGTSVIKQTHPQIIEKYKGLEEGIPDVRDSVVAYYPSGDHSVIVEFISQGTLPDSSKLFLPICTIFTLNEEGNITKDYTYYDNQ